MRKVNTLHKIDDEKTFKTYVKIMFMRKWNIIIFGIVILKIIYFTTYIF